METQARTSMGLVAAEGVQGLAASLSKMGDQFTMSWIERLALGL